MSTIRWNRRSFCAAGLAAAAAAVAPRGADRAAAATVWEPMPATGDVPGPRWDHSLVADDKGRQLLLFGGRDPGFAAIGDTWLYDIPARAWTPVDGEAPSRRFGHAVAVDQQRRLVYLFGGESESEFFNDAWRFDLAEGRWTRLHDGTGTAPSPRYGLGGVLDGEGSFLISHGFTFDGRFDDTWSFNIEENAWTDVSPPSDGVRPLKRCLHEMVWDTRDKRMLLFGGCSSGFGPCPQGDLWAFDPATRLWTELTPADGPAARSNPAVAWDRSGRQAWLVGGLTDGGHSADLWLGASGDESFTWTALDAGAGPSPRASHDAAISSRRLYLFGGSGPGGALNDLWRLQLPE